MSLHHTRFDGIAELVKWIRCHFYLTLILVNDGAYVMNQRNTVQNEVTEDCDYFVCVFFFTRFGVVSVWMQWFLKKNYVWCVVCCLECTCLGMLLFYSFIFKYYSVELSGFEYKSREWKIGWGSWISYFNRWALHFLVFFSFVLRNFILCGNTSTQGYIIRFWTRDWIVYNILWCSRIHDILIQKWTSFESNITYTQIFIYLVNLFITSFLSFFF